MPRLVIFGAGGCGGDMLRAATHSYSDIVFADDAPIHEYLGLKVIRPVDIRVDDVLIVALGNGATRARIFKRFSHVNPATVIAPTAIVHSEIGPGAAVHDFCVINNLTRIGCNFQINIYSCVGHDCVIGNDVTFGVRASCLGAVHIGDGAQIASHAVLRNGSVDRPLVIGDGAIVGMGAVVTKDVPPGTTVVGNPARPIERSAENEHADPCR